MSGNQTQPPYRKPTRTVRRFERRMEDVNGFNYQI